MKRLLLLVVAAALVAASPALAQQDAVTINFELAVEGEPPVDATFFGQYLVEGATVQLTDPDGDGVYTGSMSGGAPDAGFRIVQGTGAEQTMTGVYPGEPVTVIDEFPASAVQGDAATLSATVSFDGTGGDAVSATGVLEKPDATTYMYGTHALIDGATGEQYALESETVNLDEYVGEQVTVSGAPVPGYESGQVEGGPPLLEVSSAQPAGRPDAGATVVFDLTLEGRVPRDASFYVETSASPGEVVCVATGSSDAPACEGDGGHNRAELTLPAGEPFDYRLLARRGPGTSGSVVAEGTEVAEDGLVIEASYSFAGAPASGEDVNGDGVVDAADGDLAARVTDEAKENVDPAQGRPLPITGGAALVLLLAGCALAAIGVLAHKTAR